MRNQKTTVSFIAGAALSALLLFLIWKAFSKPKEEVRNDYYIITNQITKMNKMVVLEQDFSSMQKTRIKTELLGGGILPASEKEIISYTKTNAQVSYDLNKMKIDVDSTARKLIIRELPQAEIRIIPSVEIQSMDDSFFNRIDQDDLKKITASAKENAYKTVNQEKLRQEGKKQLMQNLQQIFVLAKALNYSISDETGQLDATQL